ncbi:MAG: GlsB/YeaQ/YmgE family stress response membrane protein [Ktedonobacteraceae bacterium]|nr:GlsB/YeaQ/YmgE family stress response membrane protein [Ktedonobacteraceae bacterium]
MMTFHTLLSDTIVISGNAFNWHFTLTLTQLIYWVIAAVIGIVAEALVGWRAPLGVLGAFLAALAGIWLMTSVLQFTIPHDIILYGVPLFKALIGSIVMVVLWHLVTYRAWRKPRHSVA